MAKKQSKREIKTGLCPNCHKFGDKCACGYNYGFQTGAELRRYIQQTERIIELSLAPKKKYVGVVKSDENSNLYIEYETRSATVKLNTGWVYSGHTFQIIKNHGRDLFDPIENGDTYELDLRGTQFEKRYPNSPYTYIKEKDLTFTTITKQFALKRSQWEATIKNNEVDTAVKVIFEIIEHPGKSPFAKIIPQVKKHVGTSDVKETSFKVWCLTKKLSFERYNTYPNEFELIWEKVVNN